MFDLTIWAPLLIAGGSLVFIAAVAGVDSRTGRLLSAWLSIAFLLRYFCWRLTATRPDHQSWFAAAWYWIFIIFESCGGISTFLTFLTLSRRIDRRVAADERAHSPLRDAPVDVWIATYNEPHAVLERTLIGALAIDHRDLRVWLLDDGSRPWLESMAREMGAHYLSRTDRSHAKAGNINHGLETILKQGRRPEFILLLDADFVAAADILKRTLGLFEEEDVGIVQTPQHFFNHDPVQSNLLCAGVWPDEQRFFFNEQMPCRDAWGTAFCCGTSAVLRVAALEACGGLATETVTEDMLTSFKLKAAGYRTIYLNEALSLGLAPENLREYVAQRSRWCLGSIQQIYTRYSLFGGARIGLRDRIAFLDTLLYWICGSVFRLLTYCAPLVFWFTGASVIQATVPELLSLGGPVFVCGVLFMRFYAGGKVLPLMTDITQLLSSPTIVRTVIQGLVRPFGRPFKVTQKGLATNRTVVHWDLLWPFLAIAVITGSGLLLQVSGFSPQHGVDGYVLNVIWSVLVITVMSLTVIACVEPPHPRLSERFETNEPAILRFASDLEISCSVRNVSLGGALLLLAGEWPTSSQEPLLVMDYGRLQTGVQVIRKMGSSVAVRFTDAASLRQGMVLKLYTGRYHKELDSISVMALFRRMVTRLLA